MASRYNSSSSHLSTGTNGTVYAPPIPLFVGMMPDPDDLERDAQIAERYAASGQRFSEDGIQDWKGEAEQAARDKGSDESSGELLSPSSVETKVDGQIPAFPEPETTTTRSNPGASSKGDGFFVPPPLPVGGSSGELPVYVDVMYANGGKPAEYWFEGRVAHDVRSWLTKPSPTAWKLRLLIGTRASITTSVAQLPFDKETFRMIKEAFCLPESTMSSAEDPNEALTYFMEDGLAMESRQLGLIYRMMTFDHDGCLLALHFDPSTCSTYALLLGLVDIPGRAVNEELADELYRSRIWAWHPLLIPSMLMKRRGERISLALKDTLAASFDFDLRQGLGDLSSAPTSTGKGRGNSSTFDHSVPQADKHQAAVIRLSSLSTDLAYTQLGVDLLLSAMRKVQELFILLITENSLNAIVFLGGDDKEEVAREWRKTRDVLQGEVSALQAQCESRALRLTQLKEKLRIQLEVIHCLRNTSFEAPRPRSGFCRLVSRLSKLLSA